MPAIQAALQTDGLWVLVLGVIVAGLVRGFSGFGTAMVYLPIAGQVLPPFEALTTLIVMDLIGPLLNIPRAMRTANMGDVGRLLLGTVIGLPLGVWALSLVPPEVFRYGVSLIAILLLLILLKGLRYHGPMTQRLILGTGGVSGFLAGAVGLPGPPVILFYMASPLSAAVIRATIMVYLLAADFLMLGVLALNDFLVGTAVVLGLVLAVPYTLGNLAGAAIFHPRAERVYRVVAYLIIAVSALHGLPVFD